MLASGDPFWFGAGSVVARHLQPGEWRALPAPSVFARAAARLGWPIETTLCVGLHAAPLARLRPHLASGKRALILLRDGDAVADLAGYLASEGFGASTLHVMEALGGPRERVRETTALDIDFTDIVHPVAVGATIAGGGLSLPCVNGLPDDLFDHDGQITKRPLRALTLSSLAPTSGEYLWDIGAGSGSIAIEWLLSDPACQATAIEAVPGRAEQVRSNAAKLGVDRLEVIEGQAPQALSGLRLPDAVFIGGGLSHDLLEVLWERLQPGSRIIANAVTLESEALLIDWHGRAGGALLKVNLAEVTSIGTKRGWQSAYPIVQWSVIR